MNKKIVIKGNVFNPTGISTANREICKALVKLGEKVQTTDLWRDTWEFNQGLESLNDPINVKTAETITIFADYPSYFHDAFGTPFAYFLHEGTRLPDGWTQQLNQMAKVFVPSKATKNLFKWNGVGRPIKIIPYGVSEMYKPKEFSKEEMLGDFTFLSVNSWTGMPNDRKGTDLLIKAFHEEFKPEEPVKLVLKIGTFWDPQPPEHYMAGINYLTKGGNKNIVFNSDYATEEDLAEYYQKSSVFVAPTRGEAFGLTILNAKASGMPVIVTKDNNSGHMDFCNDDSTLFIDSSGVEQADPRFYCEGNMWAKPNLESLKKQMRNAFENYKDLKEKAIKNSEEIREKYTWENTAKMLVEEINEDS